MALNSNSDHAGPALRTASADDESTPISTLALDLGATKLAIRLARGDIGNDYHVPLGQKSFDQICHLLREFTSRSGARLSAAALASAPTLNDEGVIVRWPSRPQWTGLPLRHSFESAIDCPIVVEDDGNAAAIAEARALAVRQLVYIGLGTGVGGGIVIDSRICHGAAGRAGELGHMIVRPDGPDCVCGRRGCLQALASGPAILARALPQTSQPLVGDLENALRCGDPVAERALEIAADSLAIAICNLSELVEPEVVVLGGGFAAALPSLIPMVRQHLQRLVRREQRLPGVRLSRHGANSSLEGAAIVARECAIEHIRHRRKQ